MRARIYLPPKSAMQSGRSGNEWTLDYASDAPERADRLMGWIGGGDTQSQVRLNFPTKEEAIAYAERNGIPYQVFEAHERAPKKLSYSDNFRFGRPQPWTH